MKGEKRRRLSLFGAIMFFVTIAVVVTAAVLVYSAVEEACGGSKAAVAGVMLAVIVVLAAIETLIDYLRRRYTVDRPVQKILDATNRIAAGDFSVRLDVVHSLKHYDEFDYIMENLNQMTAELSRTEVLHNDFVSNVSHELKTPLAVIRNYASALQGKRLNEEQRMEYAQTIVNASKRLTELVSNILKLNKLENQEIKPETVRIDLTEMLSQTLIGFEDPIEQKGLRLECDLEEDVTVLSSPSYLEIVWNNLISNAVKFTECGGVVRVSLKKEGGEAVVTVADTGCGISAETGKHIFEKFYQGDTSHAQEGNGLGLALVKKVIDITGGSIRVNSEEGKGTAFVIALKAEE